MKLNLDEGGLKISLPHYGIYQLGEDSATGKTYIGKLIMAVQDERYYYASLPKHYNGFLKIMFTSGDIILLDRFDMLPTDLHLNVCDKMKELSNMCYILIVTKLGFLCHMKYEYAESEVILGGVRVWV